MPNARREASPGELANLARSCYISPVQVNILEAKNRLSELIRCVQSGEDVIIANRGRPVARLVAEPGSSTPTPSGQTLLEWLQANPLPAYARRSAEEIDAGIEEERNAWD